MKCYSPVCYLINNSYPKLESFTILLVVLWAGTPIQIMKAIEFTQLVAKKAIRASSAMPLTAKFILSGNKQDGIADSLKSERINFTGIASGQTRIAIVLALDSLYRV